MSFKPDYSALDRDKVISLMDRIQILAKESRTGEILSVFESLSKNLIETQQELSYARSNVGNEYADRLREKMKQLKIYVDGRLSHMRVEHEQKMVQLQQAFRTELCNALAVRDQEYAKRVAKIERDITGQMHAKHEANKKIIANLSLVVNQREEIINDLKNYNRNAEVRIVKYQSEMSVTEKLLSDCLHTTRHREGQISETISKLKIAITVKDKAISTLQNTIRVLSASTHRPDHRASVGPPVLDRAEYNNAKENYIAQLDEVVNENTQLQRSIAIMKAKLRRLQESPGKRRVSI
eukprot:TRINITY_DN3319_c0_g1_i8.p1 TRINITY_DN3319_c0_g1~~TRINITY_DN3319_c0_g1_i8.p1  ORF type:complete len:295 (+),score=55.98 TRINITY_DN3319_c0_g1_i8:44-928(+)